MGVLTSILFDAIRKRSLENDIGVTISITPSNYIVLQVSGGDREELAKKLVALCAELNMCEEELYCKLTDYNNGTLFQRSGGLN